MPLAFVGTAAALVVTITLWNANRSTFGGTYVVDNFAVLFKVFFLSAALVVLLISYRYIRDGRYYQGEYYFLLLCSFLGMLTMSSSRDLLMLFISLELVSAPGFLLSGFRKGEPRSNEAALKFFLISVLSTAVMLYGMSLIYGITHVTGLTAIAKALSGSVGHTPLALAAILFVVAGFAFKVSAFPFQFWAPDTYEGSTWWPCSSGRWSGCWPTRRSPRPATCCCRSPWPWRRRTRWPARPSASTTKSSPRWSCTSSSTG